MKRGLVLLFLALSVFIFAEGGLKAIDHPIDTRLSYESVPYRMEREATLSESFEEGIPGDWQVINNDGGSYTWSLDGGAAHSGTYGVSKMYEAPSDDWLITPQITLAEGDVLTFWARSFLSFLAEHVTVWASTTNSSIDAFTIQLADDSAVSGTWTKYTIDFADVPELSTGDMIYLGFQCTSNDCYWLYLDDIVVAPLPTDPILGINYNDVAFGEIMVNENSELANCITITNSGGGSLEFTSITDLSGSEFSSDFDINTVLGMDETYSFGFNYSPLDTGLDEIDFIIEHNGGDPVTIHLSGTGYSLPEGMIEIGTGTDAFFLPTRASQNYCYSQTIYRQDEINVDGQQVASVFYHYLGTSEMTLDIDIYMGHTSQDQFGDILPLSQLVQTFSGSVTFPAEDCWVEIVMDNPFYYNNSDNLVVAFDDNDGTAYDEMNRFYSGMDIANTTYINWSTDDIDPSAPGRFIYNYRPNIRLQMEEGQATPILSSNVTSIDFGVVNVGQNASNEIILSNIGEGILTFNSQSGLEGTEFQSAFDVNTILGPGETYTFSVSYYPEEDGVSQAELHLNSNGGEASISLIGEGYQMPEGLIEIGSEEVTGTHLPVECYYNYSLSETIFLQNEINMSGQRIREISYYYAGGNGWNDDTIKIYMGHTEESGFTDWVTTSDLMLVYDGTYSVPAEAGWVTITLDIPFVYNNVDNLIIMMYEYTPGWHSPSDYFLASSVTENRSCYYFSDSVNPDPSAPPAASISAYIPNIRMQFEDIPVEPILNINAESHDFGSMYEGAISEPFNVCITNMGGSDLVFSSVTDLAGSDFVTDFDVETVIASAGSYDFSYTYMPSNVGVDQIEIVIESNGGNATINLSGEGTFAPQGEVIIGEEENIDIHLPVEPYYGYSLSESIFLQSEIVQANQRIEQISYYYAGGDGWTGDEIQILMGHTEASTFTDWIPADELTPVYNGTFDVPAEAGWVTLILDVPFSYNNVDNLVILMDENTPGWHTNADDFYGSDSGANRSIYYYNDNNNPDLYNPPAGTISTYRPNIKMTFFDIPTDPIINVSPTLLAFPTISATQSTSMNLNIVNSGGGELIVDEITATEPFYCDWTGSVLQGENVLVPVTFNPLEDGDFTGTLEISSNALNISVVTVEATGSACPEGTWFEGFESGLVPPEGWDITWQYGFELGTGSNAYEGAYSMAIDGTENSWLLSPLVEIEEGSIFSFYYKAQNSGDDTRLGLFIAPSYIDQNDISYYEDMLFEVTVDDYENWTNYEYEFSGYEGLYYLAIRRTYTGDWGTYDQAYIDNLIMPPLHPAGVSPEPPVFSHETGKYSEPFTLTLSSATPGAEIYYTTDGSYPTNESTLYNGPIDIDQSKIVYAIAYADGMEPSEKVRQALVITTPGDQVLHESFETWLDDDWTIYNVDGNDNVWQQYSGSGYISPYEGNRAAEVTQTADYNEDWLVTPRVMPTEDNHTISFWATSATQGYFMDFMVKLSTNGSEIFNFNTTVGDYNSLGRAWRPFVVDLEDYIGQPVNLAIVADTQNQFRFFVDDFEGPELFYYQYDLQFDAMSISDVLYEGMENPFEVTLRNCGVNSVSDYSIELFADDESVAVFDGQTIAPDATININYQWIPEISGSYNIYAQINLPEDENYSNNLSETFSTVILPVGSETIQIGDGNVLEYIPINYSWEYTLSQMLYLSDEINMAGYISALSFTSSFEQYTENAPVRVWVGETSATDLTDWVPTNDFQLVFDGYITSDTGVQNYLIPFDEQYQYYGGNLVVMVFNHMGDYLYGQHQFVCTDTGQANRTKLTVHYASINPLDPTSGLIDYNYSLIPNVELFYQAGEIGSLQGYVTAGGVPVTDAQVELVDSYYNSLTDASGYYEMPYIFIGDYELNINKHGFSSHTADITIQENEALEYNADLISYDQFSYNGHVILSDTQEPAVGAAISLSGYDDYYETVTDENGDFIITGIYGEHVYQYEIGYDENYSTLSGSFYLSDDYSMNDLVLNEIANRPLNAHFEIDHSNNGYLAWDAPYPEVVPVTVEGFESGSLPEGWEIIQNCQSTNTTPGWWTINDQVLEPDLVPTGSYHAGLWWVNGDIQDEWLITPEFFVPPTGYLQFDSYCWEGDYSGLGDHCYVKVSVDDGVNWDIVWDNALLTANTWNAYDHAYNIDLSAYENQNVKVAFHADGNGDAIPYIWFIDNVVFGSDIRFTATEANLANSNDTYSFRSEFTSAQTTPSVCINGETPQPGNGGRNFEESYDLYLIRWENIDDPESWELVADDYTDLVYSDENWASYPWGEYLFGIKANYSNGVQSVATISNHQEKDMYTVMNLQLTSNIEEIPSNASLILTRQYPDPAGNEYQYETESDENGQVSMINIRKGYYTVNVTAIGFEEAEFTDVFIQDSDVIILEMEEKLIPPLNVVAEIDPFTNNVDLEWTVPEAGIPTEFKHDDGVIYTGLGLGQPTENAAFGVCYYNHAVIESLKWYLGGNNSVRVLVMGLDNNGMPEQNDLIFDTGLISNTPNQWNEFELTQIIEAPNGFCVAIMTPFVFQNLGIDDGVGEPYEFIYGRQWLCLDVFSGTNDWVSDDGSHPNNWMIRAEGLNIEDLRYEADDRRYSVIETVTDDSGLLFSSNKTELDTYSANLQELTRDYESFDIYRLNEGNEDLPETWVAINAEPVTDLSYIDTSWDTVEPGDYRYAVLANYAYGISDPGFSNVLTVEVWGTLTGTVTSELTGDVIENARIVANGEETFTNEDGEYALLLNPGTWEVQCYADGYNRGEANVEILANLVSEQDFLLNEQLAVPYNLNAELENYNDVVLNWDAPVYGGGDSGWIKWDTGINVDGIGTGNTAEIEAAIRFDENDIAPYAGGLLTRIKIYPCEANCEYTLVIWGYGATEILYEQPLSTVIANAWNDITLNDPMYLNGEEIWIGYRANTEEGHPIGAGQGPMVLNKGAWIRLNGGTWNQLTNMNSSLNYNWNIQGFVVPTDARNITFNGMEDEVLFAAESQTKNHENNGKTAISNSGYSLTRDFMGYNVYRNNEIIANLMDLTYTDSSLMSGDYIYKVTALYTSGESNFSNTASINIEIGEAPQNLTYSFNEYDVSFNWDAPETQEGLLGYNIYRNDERLNEVPVTELEYIDTVPGPADYEYFITSAYEYGESVPTDEINISMSDLLLYGDIDSNWLVEAYDGALILQYVVGYDPLPVLDPLPWDEWRLIQLDVSGDGEQGAYDAALVLQYTVGMIESFPVENANRGAAPSAELSITVQNGNLIFSATGELYAFSMETRFTELAEPVTDNSTISACRNDGELYAMALASATDLTAGDHFLSIPVISDPQADIELAVTLNDVQMNINVSSDLFVNNDVPMVTELVGNYPNPFNPTTTIAYSLAEDSNVKLEVMNIKGRKIAELQSGFQNAGNYQVVWNGLNNDHKIAASGVYFYKLSVDNKVFTKKMILLK